MKEINELIIRDSSANPGPLGLFGFGMTTVLLNLHNAGFFEINSMQFVFATLTILFFLLAAGDATGNKSITHFAGYEGLVCGFAAIYTGAATLLNEVYGRNFWPLGTVTK
ncbi:MAG: hypothetical protein EOP42_27050 [Sphingobacteriaceae bacterium]|nr:MAG: hypothetical protein EOP42_27050 [Sphingobacteriaceae bacterium]